MSSEVPEHPAAADQQDRFTALSTALERACREHDAIVGLVLLGSAAAGARRDEWSDHDFFAILEPGIEDRARPGPDWLPDRDRLVLTVREGEIGFTALYDDGHVFEFAAATPAELAGVLVNDARIVYDTGPVAPLITAARARAVSDDRLARPALGDAANDVGLLLIKLLIGVGRVRRGELLAGGQMIRTWATNHLVRAVRGRLPTSERSRRDIIDPTRRFEFDYPELGGAIAAAVDKPAEQAAHLLLDLARQALEPGWPEFPSAAADVIARRLGW